MVKIKDKTLQQFTKIITLNATIFRIIQTHVHRFVEGEEFCRSFCDFSFGKTPCALLIIILYRRDLQNTTSTFNVYYWLEMGELVNCFNIYMIQKYKKKNLNAKIEIKREMHFSSKLKSKLICRAGVLVVTDVRYYQLQYQNVSAGLDNIFFFGQQRSTTLTANTRIENLMMAH